LYVPYRQSDTVLPVYALSMVLRTENDPRTQISALRSIVRQLDPDQPVVKFRTMEENIATSVSAPRFRTTLLGIFAAGALLLAVIGLYGLISYSVEQRVQEIGIRLTLGAGERDVLRMVLAQGMALALSGIAVGLAGAVALSRVLGSFLYGISPTDPVTYALVALVLLAVALAACYLPARRATRVDPMVALRHE
jgi:putative ABC transport system permease protein